MAKKTELTNEEREQLLQDITKSSSPAARNS